MKCGKEAFLAVVVLTIGLAAQPAALAEYATIRGTPIAQGQMRVAEADLERIQQAQPKAGDQFVLRETRVEGEISGVLARVRVEQVFENPYSERLEAVYVFPLPEEAAVDRYWFQVGEKVVRGVVKKREVARQEYEQAKSEGRKAALLEEERPDIFTQSVANIPSRGTITVHLEYVHLVEIDKGRYLFRFPMVVGPRYIPGQPLARSNVGRGWLPDTDQVPDASRVTPEPLPQGMRNGNDVKISLKLDAGMPIQAMTGVTHELDIKKDGETKALIQLKNQTAIPDKDFVFEYRLAGQDTVLASLAHRDESGGYFALVLQPKWKIEAQELAPREVILLLDTSGSTTGPAISQLRIFAQHVLGNLNSQDTFRIVAFNDRNWAMRNEALPAAPANVEEGKQFIRGLNSGGGTEMLPALQTALGHGATAEQNRVRYLVLVTDAMVGNDDAILGYLNQPQFHDVRVFPVAVGAAPNHYLIGRAAELGRGFSMQVTNQDNAAEMAKRFNQKMAAPYMTDLEIDWGGAETDRRGSRGAARPVCRPTAGGNGPLRPGRQDGDYAEGQYPRPGDRQPIDADLARKGGGARQPGSVVGRTADPADLEPQRRPRDPAISQRDYTAWPDASACYPLHVIRSRGDGRQGSGQRRPAYTVRTADDARGDPGCGHRNRTPGARFGPRGDRTDSGCTGLFGSCRGTRVVATVIQLASK